MGKISEIEYDELDGTVWQVMEGDIRIKKTNERRGIEIALISPHSSTIVVVWLEKECDK